MSTVNNEAIQFHEHYRAVSSGSTCSLLFLFVILSTLLLSAGITHAQQPQVEFPGLTFSLADTALDDSGQEPEQTDNTSDQRLLRTLDATRRSLRESFYAFDEARLAQLSELAVELQNAGAHTEAVSDLEELLQLTRIQYGLNASEQLPVIESLITSLKAVQDAERVDDLETLTLHLARQNTEEGSDSWSQALIRNALWNIEYFQKDYLYLHQSDRLETAASVRFFDYSMNTDGLFGNPRALFDPVAAQAPVLIQSSRYLTLQSRKLNSAEALFATVIEHPGSSLAIRAEAINQLLAILWLRNQELYLYRRYLTLNENAVITYRDAMMMETRHYREGRNLLEDKLSLLKKMGTATTEQTAQTMLDQADWHLAFGKGTRARESYREVWQYLLSQGMSIADANSFMNPSRLTMIPALIEHPFESTWVTQFENVEGEIELEADLRENGVARRLRVIDYSESATLPLRHILRNHLRNGTFRPRLIDGEAVRQDNLRLTYLFHY